jgi:hypothetical protein
LWWPSSYLVSSPLWLLRGGGCWVVLSVLMPAPSCRSMPLLLLFRPRVHPASSRSRWQLRLQLLGAAAVVVPHCPVLVLILSLLSGLAHPVHPTSSCSQHQLAVVVVVLSFPSCCCSLGDLSPCRLSVPSSTNDPPCEQLLAAVLVGVGSLTYVEVVSSNVVGIRG